MGCGLASKDFPGFSRIHLLQEPGNSRAFRGEISCTVEEAFAITRGSKPSGPIVVRWARGGKSPSDVVRTTTVAPFIVSERVIDVLERYKFLGWQNYHVELIGPDGARIPGYRGLAVTGRCGPINNSLSVKFPKIMPGGVFPWWRGLYFDPKTWDGSDLFMPEGKSAWILAVDEVKQAFVDAHITNVVFSRLDVIERSEVEMSVSTSS